MAANSRLKFHEVTTVTPFPASTMAFSLPLTFFDTYCLKFLPIDSLYFYQIHELTYEFFNSVILPKLKHSLSLTLLHYLPLAGNLMWPSDASKPEIYYVPNDGISFTVAESNADFNTISGNGICEDDEFRPLIPQLSISDNKAEVIAIQITLFPNEGFSIGISCHHAVIDGKSSSMFMKSWAYLCKQGGEGNHSLLPELTPIFDRTVINDPKGLAVEYAHKWQTFTGSESNSNPRSLKLLPSDKANHSNSVRATFELSHEDIKKLRDKVLSILDKVNENEARPWKQLHLSTYVLTCAYAYVCLVKAAGEEGNRTVIYGIVADCRSRLDPPIPVNYFGNCLGRHSTTAKANDFMKENGVGFIAEKLNDLIQELRGNVIEGQEENIGRLMTTMKQGVQGQLIIVSGSTRFDFYGSDFGWGRPKKVEIVPTYRTGAISLAERRDGGGGVEIGVVLEKKQMEVFASLFVDGLKHLL